MLNYCNHACISCLMLQSVNHVWSCFCAYSNVWNRHCTSFNFIQRDFSNINQPVTSSVLFWLFSIVILVNNRMRQGAEQSGCYGSAHTHTHRHKLICYICREVLIMSTCPHILSQGMWAAHVIFLTALSSETTCDTLSSGGWILITHEGRGRVIHTLYTG